VGRFTEKQLTIMTIVVAVVIAGLFAYLIYEDLGAIEEEEATIDRLTAQIRTADAEIAKKKGRETDVIVFREIVQRDSAILPDEAEINDFINRIGEFEKYSGVVVTSVAGLQDRRRRGGAPKEAILKIPLQLKLRGSMEQFLKFVNLFENYDRFVNISGFTIGAARGSVEVAGVRQHNIGLDLETYQYNPRGGQVKRVEIPAYERRKQELAIQKRIRSSKPAHIAEYTMKPRINRRDPLLDPREAEAPSTEPGVDPAADWERQRQLLDKLILEIDLLGSDIDLEAELKRKGDYVRLTAVAKSIDQRISELDFDISSVVSNDKITAPELKKDFTQKVVQPYEEAKEGRQGEIREILVTRTQVSEVLEQMRTKFAEGDYTAVVQIYEGFQRSIEGKNLEPEAEPLMKEMEALADQAGVIKTFESEPLKIEGVIIDKTGRKPSYAIINGRILSEGEAVDADGKIKILTIAEEEIVFEYQGIQIPKDLRGK